MSDDDSDFDKEAERERLREKYERDKEKREQSEQMSELLLQGATMTNRHCGDCGNPIFRHDGQEFCPTCQKRVGTVEEAEAEAQAEEAGETGASAQADTGAEAQADAGTGVEAQPEQPSQPEPPSQPVEQPSQRREPRAANGRTARTESEPEHAQQQAPETGGQPSRQRAAAGAGLGDAEASLARTVEQFARAAEESDDIGRAREYLAATREAAEALEAVRNAE